MVEQIFGALFIATLFVPAAALLAGVMLLVWPRRHVMRHAGVQHAPGRA